MSEAYDVEHVTIHGHRRAYVRTGSGPVILLLHGMACDHTTWDEVIPKLAETHTVIAPDLLGHGQSAKPRGDYSVAGYANGMRDLLTILDIERVTVIGHSLGGGVAMQFAYQFPEMTERVVLVAPGGVGPDVTPLIRAVNLPGSQAFLRMVTTPRIRARLTQLMRRVAQVGVPGMRDLEEIAAIIDSLSDPEARRALRAVVRASIDMRGQAVTMVDRAYLAADLPILVIWGSKDPVIPSLHADTFRTIAEHAEVEIFKRAGHFPHKDRPQRFVAQVEKFIGATQPATYSKSRWKALLRTGGGPGVGAHEPHVATVA